MPSDRPQPLSQVYDTFAAEYDRTRSVFDISEVLEDFSGRIPATGSLLDLGCGAGEPVCRYFLERGWTVTGVDFSPAMLALAQRQLPGIKAVLADMRDVDFPASSFDAVCAVYSLFHIPSADHSLLFMRIRDWLRSSGVLMFTYATRDYTGFERFEGCKAFMGHQMFYSHDTPSELSSRLERAGFEVLDFRNRIIGSETFLWVSARRSP
jgi:cyclopropane fatty-acyl-phospholipid synthase-like methyltransferase